MIYFYKYSVIYIYNADTVLVRYIYFNFNLVFIINKNMELMKKWGDHSRVGRNISFDS